MCLGTTLQLGGLDAWLWGEIGGTWAPLPYLALSCSPRASPKVTQKLQVVEGASSLWVQALLAAPTSSWLSLPVPLEHWGV